jgi:hypothetical protein
MLSIDSLGDRAAVVRDDTLKSLTRVTGIEKMRGYTFHFTPPHEGVYIPLHAPAPPLQTFPRPITPLITPRDPLILPLPPARRAAEPEPGPGSGGGHRRARVGRTAAGGVSRGSQRGGEAACGLRATLGWRKGAAYWHGDAGGRGRGVGDHTRDKYARARMPQASPHNARSTR